jgi:hypothetical protein
MLATLAAQGISASSIPPGTILLIRSGFNFAYNALSQTERTKLAARDHASDLAFAGLEQTEAMRDFLHDKWFAAVAGDAPSFERWPAPLPKGGIAAHFKNTEEAVAAGKVPLTLYLHESLLALWGVPIGEMFDLEGLAEKCRERKRWEFFFTSSPANVLGGVGSHVNGMAIF